MERSDVMAAALTGEDSRHQFKENIFNIDSLAAEMAAFLNSDGGTIYIGIVDKVGDIKPLSSEDVFRINQMISNAAHNNVKPSFAPHVENVQFDDGVVMCVQISKGQLKPYLLNDGSIWVKCGSDKRRVTSKEELLRMFQDAGALHGDEMPVPLTSIDDFDLTYFKRIFEKITEMPYESQTISLQQLLCNMNLMRDGQLTVAGLVLFGTDSIRYKLSSATVQVARFRGTDVSGSEYISKDEYSGKLTDVYQKTMSFCLGNVGQDQNAQSVNSLAFPSVPRVVFEELITNALVHRDFFVLDSVKVLIFDDRIEIISPGHLPNSLTVANILSGNACRRNSVIVSYASRLLQFSGFGSGIRRALKAYPDIQFLDDRERRRFVATISKR